MDEVTMEERLDALQKQRVAERKRFAEAVWNYDGRGCDSGAREFLREAGIAEFELVEWGMAPRLPPDQTTVRMVIELCVDWDDVDRDDDDDDSWMVALARQIEHAVDGHTGHGCYPTASRLLEGSASYLDRDHQALVVPSEQQVFGDG